MSGPRAISGFGILLCLWGSVPGISWAQTAPVIQSISPDAVPEGSPSTTINLKGSGFNSSSVARLTSGFQSLPTTFIDSETLQTVIPASSLSSPGSVFLDVYNADTRISSQRQLGFIVYSTSPPVVTSIDVFGAGRGSTFTMQINGSYLALAIFSFGGSGIAAVSATANDTGVQVQIAVAGDAPPGPQTMTITTRVGSTSTCGQKPCSLSVVSDTGSWSATGPFHDMRAKVAAVRLLDGRVLVAGGGNKD